MSNKKKGRADLHVVEGRKKKKSFLRSLIKMILVFLLVFAVILVWQNWDSIAPDSLVVWFNETMAGGQKGDGFPISVSGNNILQMQQNRDGLVTIGDSDFVMYNHNGGEAVRRQHGFSNPAIVTYGKWSMIYDQGGKKIRIETRGKTLLEHEFSENIISADIGEEGKFAVATRSSSGYVSAVYVLDVSGKEICNFLSSDLYISDISIDPDGQSIAAVGMKLEGNDLNTNVVFINFDSSEIAAKITNLDTMCVALKYFKNGSVAVVGNDALFIVNRDNTINQRHDYQRKELLGFSFNSNNVSVVLETLDQNLSELKVISPTGDMLFEAKPEGEFRNISSDAKSTLVLTSEKIYSFAETGEFTTGDIERDGLRACFFGKKTMLLSLFKIDSYDFGQ